MKKIYSMVIAAALCSAAAAQEVKVDFEDINLAENSYDNGVGAEGKFKTGGFVFANDYHSDYGGYWYGFSISTETSTAYASLADQYNSCVGTGAEGSKTYAVGYYSAYAGIPMAITQAESKTFVPKSVCIANAAYAFSSMCKGDSYAKKFDETDWFKVTFIGKLNGTETGRVDIDLAKEGMLVFAWKTIDLSALGEVDEIGFDMTSSDTGAWGMNTPAYFCLDNFVAEVTEVTSIRSVASTKSAGITAVYDANGARLNALQKGLNIVRMSDGSVQKLYK